MEKQKSSTVLKAEEKLAKVTQDAKEAVRIWEFVEESREKTPNPGVLKALRSHYDDIIARPWNERLLSPEYYNSAYEADEILIRMLASSEKPINPILLIDTFELNEEKLDKQTAREEIWNLIDKGLIEWGEKRSLTLTPIAREQFR